MDQEKYSLRIPAKDGGQFHLRPEFGAELADPPVRYRFEKIAIGVAWAAVIVFSVFVLGYDYYQQICGPIGGC